MPDLRPLIFMHAGFGAGAYPLTIVLRVKNEDASDPLQPRGKKRHRGRNWDAKISEYSICQVVVAEFSPSKHDLMISSMKHRLLRLVPGAVGGSSFASRVLKQVDYTGDAGFCMKVSTQYSTV
jgi:hypothetical protein